MQLPRGNTVTYNILALYRLSDVQYQYMFKSHSTYQPM